MNFGKTANWSWYGVLALIFFMASTAVAGANDDVPGRDPKQAIDAE